MHLFVFQLYYIVLQLSTKNDNTQYSQNILVQILLVFIWKIDTHPILNTNYWTFWMMPSFKAEIIFETSIIIGTYPERIHFAGKRFCFLNVASLLWKKNTCIILSDSFKCKNRKSGFLKQKHTGVLIIKFGNCYTKMLCKIKKFNAHAQYLR